MGGDEADWIERIAKLFGLMERGTIVLVEAESDAQLGSLVRALCRQAPDLRVFGQAAEIEEAPEGAVALLALRPSDAPWLNVARPIFAERAFRTVLFSKPETTAKLAQRAPDFFDWIERRIEAPGSAPPFAVEGLRAASRASASAVAWRGRFLDECFAVAVPRRKLVPVDASLPDESLLNAVLSVGSNWVRWFNVSDEETARRVRRVIRQAERAERGQANPEALRAIERLRGRGLRYRRHVLDNPLVFVEDAWPVADELAELTAASERLAAAGADNPARLAALLDLEPEAIELALSELQQGTTSVELEQVVQRARDPGAALARFNAERRGFDALLVGALRAPAPVLRALVHDERVKAARAALAGTHRPALPPLTERLPSGPEGQRELERLTQQLLRREAEREGFESAPRPPSPSSEGMAPQELGHDRITELLHRCPPLLARYYPEAAKGILPGYDGTPLQALGARYRECIAVHHNRLKTIGIPPQARPRESRVELPLNALFIDIHLTAEGEQSMPESLQQVIAKHRAVVVLADPGMGKSTLLAYLAYRYASGDEAGSGAEGSRLVPLHVPLRDYVRRQRTDPGLGFIDYLEAEARERLQVDGIHRAFFEAALLMGEAVVLFDGLDEVGSETARHALATSIRAFHARYPDCRFWVTSRIYGYTENVRLPAAFAHYRIAPLDRQQIDTFIERWYDLQLPGSAAEAKAQTESLRSALAHSHGVGRLAANPLLLTLIAFIHHGLRRLPKDRGELYEKCIEMLLKTWQEAKREGEEPAPGIESLALTVPTQKDYLAHLAFFIQATLGGGTAGEARGTIERRAALDALTSRHLARARRERPGLTELEAREEMGRFLDYVCDTTGLLLDRGSDQLSFVHLSFQEYLAAWAFLCDGDLPRGPEFFIAHLGDPAWEEVLLLRLYIVLRGGGGGEGEFDRIIGSVLRELERRDLAEGWMTLLRALRDDLEFREGDRKTIIGKAVDFWLQTPEVPGKWFGELEALLRFGSRSRETLREVIAARRISAADADTLIALLHLETGLFGVLLGAAATLRQRADLPALLPDLVAFLGDPEIARLLAEEASIDDWSRALEALDSPTTYRLTVCWMTEAPSPAAMLAATAQLWAKALGELQERAAFAETRRDHPYAILSRKPGTLKVETPFSSVSIPDGYLRIVDERLPASQAATATLPRHLDLARGLLRRVVLTDEWRELTDWLLGVISTHLRPFVGDDPLDLERLRAAVRLFGREKATASWSPVAMDPFWFRPLRANRHEWEAGLLRWDAGATFAHTFLALCGKQILKRVGSEPLREFGGTFLEQVVDHVGSVWRWRKESAIEEAAACCVTSIGIDPREPGWLDEWNHRIESNEFCRDVIESGLLAQWELPATRTKVFQTPPTTAASSVLKSPFALPVLLASYWTGAQAHQMLTVLVRAAEDPGNRAEAVMHWQNRHPLAVYATAFAWEEHCKSIDAIEGARGALILAHAGYAALMTDIACKLPVTPNLGDPRVAFSHALYELCHLRDTGANAKRLWELLATPPPELRPVLEAARLLRPDAAASLAGGSVDSPATDAPLSTSERTTPAETILFSWLHLSDIHCGHPNVSHGWDQKLVLDALLRDTEAHETYGAPRPDVVLLTGDIAFSGRPEDYERAREYLGELARRLTLSNESVFVVPGNHDVDRRRDQHRSTGRLIRGLRQGEESLDEALASPEDRALLASRMEAYLGFAAGFPNTLRPDPFHWSHTVQASGGLAVRLVGLATALLCADDLDHGKLRLGNQALATTLSDTNKSSELVLVLTHHPLTGGWLADQRDAAGWLESRAHLHLCGHVHEADSAQVLAGSGRGMIRVTAGAAHGDRGESGAPASHGYNVGAVVLGRDGALRLRIWPRLWSERNKAFRSDVHNVPEGASFAEHPLPPIRRGPVATRN